MLIKPTYAENIIVGVIYDKVFRWYVTEKELWFLDYNKLEKAYLEKGFEIKDYIDDNDRNGVEVLDEHTAGRFLEQIKHFLTTKEELKDLLMNKVETMCDSDDLLDFSPTLLVDFDNKSFYSIFPEPASFEEYVPDGWTGKYLDFTNLIQDKEKYWLSSINENIFLKYQ
jgi:hypothetical protein